MEESDKPDLTVLYRGRKVEIPTHAKDCKTASERVECIAEIMESLRWVRGKTAGALAEVWGISKSRVQDLSTEASRLVVADAGEARRDISAGCQKLFGAAIDAGDAKSAKAMGDLWASVSGAKAPDKHEVTTTEATPERAAQLVREKFGEHLSKPKEGPEGAEEAPEDP